MGPPVRHGCELKLSDDAACPGPDVHTTTQTSRYGAADARAWHRVHPKLKARGAWAGHQGELPVIEGTLIKLTAGHLPHDRAPKPVWLWASCPDADSDEVNRCWQAFLRRFDIEHTFRFLKQVLGWTRPRLRDPAAAGRWTWLILAGHAQLWLARTMTADLRLPWQRPAPAGRLTPARVRRGFRAVHGTLPRLAAAPKPGKPGPGRPPGSKNRHPAARHDVDPGGLFAKRRARYSIRLAPMAMILSAAVPSPVPAAEWVCHVHAACRLARAGSADRRGDRGHVRFPEDGTAAGGGGP
jgi:hypothetical protein